MATLKDNSGNTASVTKFGGSSGIRSRTASKLDTAGAIWSATSITVRMNEDTGTPTGDIQIGIFEDTSGKPGTTQVGGYATITAAEISGVTFADFTKSFSSPATLNYGYIYWIVFRVSAGEDDSNYYSARAITTAASGNGAKFNEPSAGVWTNNTDNLYYILTGTVTTVAPSAGSLILTGNDQTLNVIIPFAPTTGTLILTGNAITFKLFTVPTFTNLTKHSSSFTNQTKHSSTFTNQTKTSSTWINQAKS